MDKKQSEINHTRGKNFYKNMLITATPFLIFTFISLFLYSPDQSGILIGAVSRWSIYGWIIRKVTFKITKNQKTSTLIGIVGMLLIVILSEQYISYTGLLVSGLTIYLEAKLMPQV